MVEREITVLTFTDLRTGYEMYSSNGLRLVFFNKSIILIFGLI